MIHPHTELRFIDEEIGFGVIATKKIPRGTITWALDKLDRIFTPPEVESLEPIYKDIIDKYGYRNRRGEFVLCWDFGRYVNHSFNSNCMSTGYEFEIAIRDIEAGEELTNDYGYLNLTEPFKPRNENTARKVAYPDDLLMYHDVWDKLLNQNFHLILQVEQPLLSLIPKDVMREVKETNLGQREMKSILSHYFEDAHVHA